MIGRSSLASLPMHMEMYHLEFYKKMLARIEGGNPFLSGIIGDAWAGSVNVSKLDGPEDVHYLGYTHGLHADSGYSQYPVPGSRLTNYWDTQKERLQDKRVCVIEAMRFKMILLCYPNCSVRLARKNAERLFHPGKVEGVLKGLGFSSNVSERRKAYNAYCVLLPIENLLRKRNLTRHDTTIPVDLPHKWTGSDLRS